MEIYVVMVIEPGFPVAAGAWSSPSLAGVQRAQLEAEGHKTYIQAADWNG